MAVRRTNLYRDLGDTGLNQTGWGEVGDEFLREWQGAGEKAIGIERNIAGMPVLHLPEGADTTESEDDTTDIGRARRIVRNVRADELNGLVLPFGWEFSLVASSGGAGAADTDMVISRYNKQMLMAALSQFLVLGMDNVGALATFEAAGDFFTLTLNAVADTIAETFTKFAVERLLLLNGFDPVGVRLEHSPAGDVQPGDVTDALVKLVGAGAMTLTAEDEVWLRSLLRLPARDVADIEAGRDIAQQEAAERAAAMRQALAQRQPAADDADDADDVDEQSADIAADAYATGGNDAYRLRMERQWQRKMAAFLARQGRDVTRQAKREYRQ